PKLKATLYGEVELNAELLTKPGAILMPAFAFANMPDQSVDISFSAHVLGDLPPSAVRDYLDGIARSTRGFFLHVHLAEIGPAPKFTLIEKRRAGWNAARARDGEMEYLYKREPQ